MKDIDYAMKLYGVQSEVELSHLIERDHIQLIKDIEKHQGSNKKPHQHLNPVSALVRFSDHTNRIIRVQDGESQTIGIRDAAVQKNFYNAPIMFKDKYALENYFGEIEGNAKSVLDRMSKASYMNFNNEDLDKVCKFLAAQCIRSAEYREFFKDVSYTLISNIARKQKVSIIAERRRRGESIEIESFINSIVHDAKNTIEFENDFYSIWSMRHFTMFYRDFRQRSITIKRFNDRRLITAPNPVMARNLSGADVGMKFFNSNLLYALSPERYLILNQKKDEGSHREVILKTGSNTAAKRFNKSLAKGSLKNVFFMHPDDEGHFPYLYTP